jgi:hypothetical protein
LSDSNLRSASLAVLATLAGSITINNNSLLASANFQSLLRIPGEVYIANNLQLLSANFMRVTRIDGSLSFVDNMLLNSVNLSVLTTIVGSLLYSNNPRFARITAPVLVSFDGRNVGQCSGCTTTACSGFLDMLSCSTVLGSRTVFQSSVTMINNPVLTRAAGYFEFDVNRSLLRLDFASLSFIGDFFGITRCYLLTFASFPKLSRVQGELYFCDNHPTFLIPSAALGTAAPPGLSSVSSGSASCWFQNGTGTCNNNPMDICP